VRLCGFLGGAPVREHQEFSLCFPVDFEQPQAMFLLFRQKLLGLGELEARDPFSGPTRSRFLSPRGGVKIRGILGAVLFHASFLQIVWPRHEAIR
jgi:hypothetical protein